MKPKTRAVVVGGGFIGLEMVENLVHQGFKVTLLQKPPQVLGPVDPENARIAEAVIRRHSRKLKVQPLPMDVADALRDYLTGKPAAASVWGGTWASGCTGAEMVRRDLEAVGISYAVEGPDGPEYADFHALRHTYLTMLGRNGVDLRTAQELAGHSTPLLTARYSHRRLYDLVGAVESCPTSCRRSRR